MELQNIIDKLQNYKPEIINKVDEPAYIQTHKMMKCGQTNYFPECLYVGYVSDLPPAISIERICNLICIGNELVPDQYLQYKNLNLILIGKDSNQIDILNQIADIMIDEAKLISDMKRLLDALYSGLGLQHMVDIAFEAFGNPIFINDTSFKILAMSQNTVYYDPILEEEKSLGYIHESNVTALKRDKMFERTRNSDCPILSKKDDESPGWLFRSIKIHEIVVGEVGLVENNRPFRTIDYELIDRFSKLVALQIEKNDFYKDNKGVMYSYLLADMLSGKLQDIKSIIQRLTYLNCKVYKYSQIMVLTDHETSLNEIREQNVGQQLNKIIPNCFWTVYQNKTVVFFSRPNDDFLTSKERQQLEDFTTNNNLSAGLSNSFSNILETQKYYYQALKAGDLGFYIHKKPFIYLYSDYIITFIAEVLAKEYNLQDFFHPAIPIIQKYDKEHNAKMLDTLGSYLRYIDNPVMAADQLYIHRNTLLYRINKIKELTRIDLGNGDERLQLQLSLKFLEFLKEG